MSDAIDEPTSDGPVDDGGGTSDGDGASAPRKRRRRRRRRGGSGEGGAEGSAAASATTAEAPGSGEDDAEGADTAGGGDDASPRGEGSEGDARPKRSRGRRRRGRRGGEGGEGGGPDGGDRARTDGSSDQRTPEPEPEPTGPPRVMTGVLELSKGGEGRLRQVEDRLVRNEGSDPWFSNTMIRDASLRDALTLEVEVVDRAPRKRGRGRPKGARPTVERIISIEGAAPEIWAETPAFAELLAIDPQPRLSLEHPGCAPACRLIDLFCPIGYGTRGLIVAPPKAGKTILLQNIASGIKTNHPEVELIALLIDERPEEVTDFKRNVPAEVFASSNDLDVDAHTELGILAIERARRRLEAGHDVVVLLDSLTRLGRAFNNSRRYASGGRTMSGGLDSRALDVPKQLFGAARNVEGGGSLTIIATCLVDTGSRADQIIFEEFKGTGNMELILDRSISDQRLFPAINLAASGTRKEDLLMEDHELKTVTALRRRLLSMKPPMQIEQLLKALGRFETNEDLVRG